MKTFQQQRAHHALTQIRQLNNRLTHNDEQQRDKERGEFRAHVRNLPAMIHTNGLGQSIAFYYSKRKKISYQALCDILADWLLGEGGIYSCAPRNAENLLVAITAGDMYHYLNAQAEALVYLEWAKKFAEALIEQTEASDA